MKKQKGKWSERDNWVWDRVKSKWRIMWPDWLRITDKKENRCSTDVGRPVYVRRRGTNEILPKIRRSGPSMFRYTSERTFYVSTYVRANRLCFDIRQGGPVMFRHTSGRAYHVSTYVRSKTIVSIYVVEEDLPWFDIRRSGSSMSYPLKGSRQVTPLGPINALPRDPS